MNEINKKCRTCFTESSKGMQSLTKKYSDEGKRQKSFAELLNDVANINIHDDKYSKLPKTICGCCARKLKAADAFIQKAKEVNEKFHSILQTDSFGSKPSDCLQEVPIGIDLCADIKTESDNAYDSDKCADGTDDTDFLKKVGKLKQEDPEEDTLAPSHNKNYENLEEGKYLKDFLDITVPDISITTEISNNVPNVFEHNMDTSDDNSDNKSLTASGSDDSEWQQNISNNSSKKVLKKSKKATKADANKEKDQSNEDEWLQVKCDVCDKLFDNSRLLKQHLRLNHVPDELKIQCRYCQAKFSQRHNMYAHMRRLHKTENLDDLPKGAKKVKAEIQHSCQQCPRSYSNKYKLTAHIKSYHDPNNKNPPKERVLLPKKRFLCTLCGSKFDSKGNLNIHFRRHTGEKPFKCEFCDRAYPRLYDVTVHRRTHTGEKPYECTICLKSFIKYNKLKIHMRTHTNERPYKCTQCEKAFKQSKDLTVHKRTHTGERPYKCAVCDSTFTQSNSLRLHQIKQQHLDKPNVADNTTEGTAFTSIL